MRDNEEFVAYPTRSRIALLILVTFGFVLMGLWAVGAFGPPFVSDRASPAVTNAIGWVSIVFFGFCGLTLIKAFFDKRERLRINTSGVHWLVWSDELIPWSEISDVTTWQCSSQKMIVLHLHDAGRFPSASPLAKFSGASRALTGGDIAITLAGTDRSHRDALEAIGRFR